LGALPAQKPTQTDLREVSRLGEPDELSGQFVEFRLP